MLKTTEQAIWSAKLSKFSRGRPAPPGLSTDHSPSSQASLLPVSWQHFSGPDLLCTVTFSTHKSSCEPSHIPAGASQPYDGLQSASISDRQFRIAVGWASNVAHSVSASLNALEDIDLVAVQRAAQQAGYNEFAVNAIHRNNLVGLRYRSVADPHQRHRCQLVFAQESDKRFFLTLIKVRSQCQCRYV
ncbi:hypothetical protein BCV70DRAFT_28595 [Testicularia cyperi]|uniref:Uncharacterized protein n=1 Tax=Testicularia cyperi TaxID=1882483 RepID=A0A317XL87_9BASI|nr:hypothetical protein BCV70DRAFT_28595 [Testicularia cyperi]